MKHGIWIALLMALPLTQIAQATDLFCSGARMPEFRSRIESTQPTPSNGCRLAGSTGPLPLESAPDAAMALEPALAWLTPERTDLEQNYPNPFNPATQIAFDLARSGYTRLSVYDVLGREVALLLSDWIAAGHYEVSFDGTFLPAGVYLYRLDAQDCALARKMLLVQ